LIIDDLGHGRRAGVRAVTLKGPVAVAILPHTRHSMLLAELAHLRAKEVLLHLPLQPEDMDWQPDPGGIRMSVGEAELLRILRKNLQVMPHVSGVSNHMGSLFTRQPGNMAWIMRELRRRARGLRGERGRAMLGSGDRGDACRHGIPPSGERVRSEALSADVAGALQRFGEFPYAPSAASSSRISRSESSPRMICRAGSSAGCSRAASWVASFAARRWARS